jgi:hypothetical protein
MARQEGSDANFSPEFCPGIIRGKKPEAFGGAGLDGQPRRAREEGRGRFPPSSGPVSEVSGSRTHARLQTLFRW